MVLNGVALKRNTQAFEQVIAVVDRIEKQLGEHKQLVEENEVLIRGMTQRNEKAVQDLLRRDAKFAEEMAQHMDVTSTNLREILGEMRAQSQAIFILIDRSPPP